VTDNPADSDAATAAREAEEESWLGDGDVDDDGERILYSLVASTTDPTTNDLQREVWDGGLVPPDYGTPQTVITNVERLDFVYFDDSSPTPLTSPLSAGDLAKVDRVEITLLVRTTNEDYRYTDRETYSNLQDTPLMTNVGDHFRRRVFSMSVQIRNNI
jgi:8-oxo-dGTP pyrophosphatase MutT (NUDIX family)